LPKPVKALLEPRKTPVQARSAASVEAILEATAQVLLAVGKERLTTTLVASRAGVSVGTLYQYFPNKSALLQAALRRHLEGVTTAVEQVCLAQHGNSLKEVATAVITAFLNAKMRNGKASVAFYSVSSDVDGAKISQHSAIRSSKAIVAMLERTSGHPIADPQLAASMLTGAMVGVSRRLLESPAPEKNFELIKQELIFLACAYLEASSSRQPAKLLSTPTPPRTHAHSRIA
jgi:AcrR family transcriptional regulator